MEAVQAYLTAFNTALKNRPFRRLYIDAFAGSGDFQYSEANLPSLFEQNDETLVHAGSARRALEVVPPFDRLIFIESAAKNVTALRELAAEDSLGRASVVPGDANAEVTRICRETNWANTRGVIFLDPFGNSVAWSTLEAVAKTKALDVWYLFPLAGIYRNAPRNREALTAEKRSAITRILGTDQWETRFYSPPALSQPTLFEVPQSAGRRELNVDGIEVFVKERLQTIFPLVEPPLRLLGINSAPLFSLFFAMANPSPRAHAVARPIAAHILRNL